jgi:hypothetical protein
VQATLRTRRCGTFDLRRSGIGGENEVGEAEDAAVRRHVLAQAVVELCSDLIEAATEGIGLQPPLKTGSPGRLEVVPFSLVAVLKCRTLQPAWIALSTRSPRPSTSWPNRAAAACVGGFCQQPSPSTSRPPVRTRGRRPCSALTLVTLCDSPRSALSLRPRSTAQSALSTPVPRACGARATARMSSSPHPQPRSSTSLPGASSRRSSSRSAWSCDSGVFQRIRP